MPSTQLKIDALELKRVFENYFDSEHAFNMLPYSYHPPYRKIIDDFYKFKVYTDETMHSTAMAIYDQYGMKMKHEWKDFILTHDKLEEHEKRLFWSFVTNSGYFGRVFDLFCETYEGFDV